MKVKQTGDQVTTVGATHCNEWTSGRKINILCKDRGIQEKNVSGEEMF